MTEYMHRERHTGIAIIGAGFSGIGAAARLKREGVRDFVVFERAGSVGGTWRDNDYPGSACDVPSHLYSYSFAPRPDWPRSFATQPEIYDYLENVVDRCDVRQHLLFHTAVTTARWDSSALHWKLWTTSGTWTADIVIAATGPLSDPAIPHVPGMDAYMGSLFHTSQWNHGLDLSDARVALIGTGASAAQVIPAVARQARHLTVLQRTPAWVLPRLDRRITAPERWLHRRLPATRAIRRASLWGVRELQAGAFTSHPNRLKVFERISRSHLYKSVQDPQLRSMLTPEYRIGCKRIILSDEYYPSFTRPNTTLLPSPLKSIDGGTLIAENGVRTEADVTILATGYRATDPYFARNVIGVDGRSLSEHRRNGVTPLRGTTTPGFPNLLVLAGPGTLLGNNSLLLMIESQLNYLVDFVRRLRSLGGRAALDARASATMQWHGRSTLHLDSSVWNNGGCDSWYLDSKGRNTSLWYGRTAEFRRLTRKVKISEYHVLRVPTPSAGE